ncbi:MAG: sugar ABC transporter ATP-binding protein [Candidatus Diapherotrites archaeon CG08_land_8_20_14_0_20_30_16]|nr:MAG: sugar ABC transporter ATP-binding protein [Candidatus Diapherotrites archaeon CG08_land_8_20_14_0_20_30_16]
MSDKIKVISVKNISKSFRVPKKPKSTLKKIANLFVKAKKKKQIIKDLSFDIYKGDIVGYIGENGSGKSTTIKMLTGIYPPSSGKITCLGKNPFEQRIDYVKDIGVVFGNKSLLNQDIAPIYSIELQAAIYDIPEKLAKKKINQFAKKLQVEKLLKTPVRKLSLGERMKFEIIASLLHNPKIIFLDEPTIGLDVIARERMIQFLKTVNEKEKTTIFLTTHNMDDIEEICNKIIILDYGKKVYDGNLKELKEIYANWKRITIVYNEKYNPFCDRDLEIIEKTDNVIVFKAPNKKLEEYLNKITNCFEIIDLKIEEPTLKEIVKRIYADGYVPK